MPRLRPAKTNFSRGELDPQALMRHDTVAFDNGAEKLRNVLVFPQGGARRRDGLENSDTIPPLGAALIPSVAINKVKAIEFRFSISQLYNIIFVREFFYIFRDNNFVFEGSHNYLDSEIPALNWTQDLDTLFLFHENHEQRTLVRSGSDTVWVIADFPLTDTPTVVFDNKALGTLTPSAVGDPEGTVTVTSSVSQFVAGDVGKFIRGNGGYGEITSFTTGLAVILTLVTSFDDADIIGNGLWSKEEEAISVTRGWPVSGTVFQGRLVLAGARDLPDFVAMSRSGVIANFANSSADEDSAIVAFSDTPGISTFLNVIAGRHLQILANDAEFYVPASEDSAITPNNVNLRRNSSVGSRGKDVDETRINIKPEELDGILYFIQKGGGDLRSFVFSDTETAYKVDTVAVVSSHLIRDPIDMAARRSQSITEPNYVWICNGRDGTLAAFCVLASELVNAWTLQSTKGDFIAASVLDQDSYFIVKRFIDGADVFTLERFVNGLLFDAGTLVENLGAPVSSVSGLDYLEGEDVGLILDGSFQGLFPVVAGVLVFPRDAEDSYQFGIPFPDVDEVGDPDPVGAGNNVLIKPLPDDFAVPDGSTMGKRKRVVNVSLRVFETQSFYVNNKKLTQKKLGENLLNQPPPKVTKDIIIKAIPGYTRRGQFTITQQEPQAMTILGFAYDLAV